MMIALQVESAKNWYEPTVDIYPIDDFSSFKKELICSRFEAKSVEELTVGSYTDNGDIRVTVVEIDD